MSKETMRKVKLQMQVSADSFIAEPNGEMDWMTWNWGDDLKQYVTELTDPVDCILLGRVLAQGFIPAWEGQLANPGTEDAASVHKMVDTPKVVFTKTLDSLKGQNVQLEKGDLVEAITRLKATPGKDIIAYGGSNFVSNLIQHGLIDEYYLFVNPAAIGNGMPIFKERTNLKLVNARPFECGVVVLHYVPVR